ncbi:thiosulfate reductase cytochrome b subunit [Salmonella enterica subsp. enterica serovar Typhimurium str. DT104]|nr:thiosulfate reductase cytochrome b subunit [Salmonella enterica subsp. enterica serovar Typhimurium str. DT104]
MNTIWGAELHYAPDYWPLWLIYAGVVVLLMLVGLVIHALLRRMLAPKTAGGEEIVTISTRWRFAAGIGEMRYCLFYYC